MRNNILRALLPAFFLLIFAGAAQAKESIPQMQDDMAPLIERSDLIVLAHVTELNAGMAQTRIRLTVDEVYKGPADTKQINLEHGGGKHTVMPDEPTFSTYDKAILYLRKGPGDAYRCVDGAQGKKTLMNDNVYLDPGNGFASMPFKKYHKLLTEKVSQESLIKAMGNT